MSNGLLDHPMIGNLDGFVHNSFALPTRRELENLWVVFGPVLTVLLDEPTASPPEKK